MAPASIAEVAFHSNKNCFIFVESNVLNSNHAVNELRYFSISSTSEQETKPIYVGGYLLDLAGGRRNGAGSQLLINGIFANRLGLNIGDKVLVTLLDEPSDCFAVTAEPLSADDWEVVQINAESIEQQLLVQLRVAFAGMEFPVWIDGGYCIFLRFVSCDAGTAPYARLVDDTEITITPKLSTKTDLAFGVKSDKILSSERSQEDNQSLILLRGVRLFDVILDKLLWHAELSLSKMDPIFIGYPLIVGAAGTGKTSVANAFCLEMEHQKLAACTCVVDCKLLKGKAVESVEKRLKDKISTAIESQPAVIVLDDLDCLCSSCSTLESITPGISMLYERMTRMVTSLIADIRRFHHRIFFLGTCSSRTTLNPLLFSPRGVRSFNTVVEIREMDYDNRRALIGQLLKQNLSSEPERNHLCKLSSWVAKRANSFVLADLAVLIERAFNFLYMESGDKIGNQYPTVSNFQSALQDFIPIALHSVGHPIGTSDKELGITFDDIGGMADAKSVLEKVLLLPNKYPRVFATLPIRLPRGILLYGPSGCGKTFMAAAVARDYGLNFVHVKGAELLSKYIGASEQAVRDTFSRAKSQKPCLIFFDEFDALAPRRGHDSTGVTDRVVNQLLTEMDGVESLEGVFVLAASSRPDLIDPALLRPGRIDKRVYCGTPSEAERLDILVKISRPLSLANDVDLKAIAMRTDTFTGADLKAILLDAHLLALREATTDEPGGSNAPNVCVTQDHLVRSLASSKPSISTREKQRFLKMYEAFRSDTGDESARKFYQENVGKRATLA